MRWLLLPAALALQGCVVNNSVCLGCSPQLVLVHEPPQACVPPIPGCSGPSCTCTPKE